jgi:hypothetical protein
MPRVVNWVRIQRSANWIVDHDRIARGLRALVDRKSGPQRAGVDRPEEARAGLGVDGEHEVHHLDVMVRADVAHRVRRVDAEAEEIEVVLVAQPLEVLDRGRNRQRRCRSLEDRVARVADIFDGRGCRGGRPPERAVIYRTSQHLCGGMPRSKTRRRARHGRASSACKRQARPAGPENLVEEKHLAPRLERAGGPLLSGHYGWRASPPALSFV